MSNTVQATIRPTPADVAKAKTYARMLDGDDRHFNRFFVEAFREIVRMAEAPAGEERVPKLVHLIRAAREHEKKAKKVGEK